MLFPCWWPIHWAINFLSPLLWAIFSGCLIIHLFGFCTLSNCSSVSFLKLKPQGCLVVQLRLHRYWTQLMHFIVYPTGNTAYTRQSDVHFSGNNLQLLTPVHYNPLTRCICRCVLVLVPIEIHPFLFLLKRSLWTSVLFSDMFAMASTFTSSANLNVPFLFYHPWF